MPDRLHLNEWLDPPRRFALRWLQPRIIINLAHRHTLDVLARPAPQLRRQLILKIGAMNRIDITMLSEPAGQLFALASQ